ncbi:AAA family ATPase [Geodermatophilus sp. DSM 45219]|uniref:AAA family ATPase n=1 Tax=Geodermatophilus sp. DSM 45219 TaxID=1881103 RepID=UPI00088C50F4|nr:AAA family ATPase [Geodermatophilus sp. DSM 45219]SDN38828.1 RecF/RecN/SMC N terminal domain-containing protein [Geodermatophilus sp. DSM 45219]
MIQILALHIEEFRGIRNLKTTLDGKSFAIHGPNGSGKSGVVDAIGFAFTGTIARLSGSGTAGITVQKHGPHVHKRDDPGAAKVALTFRDTASGQTGVITRTVKNPASFSLQPDTAELRQALTVVQQHPELTLSRREIIKFILSEAGKRAGEVQALLRLETLDAQRKALKSALGKVAGDKSTAHSNFTNAQAAASRHFDLQRLTSAEVLGVVNGYRAVLGLTALENIALGTDLKEGLDDRDAEVALDKPSAVRDVQALQAWLADQSNLNAALAALTKPLATLQANPGVLDSLKHRAFVETGLTLVETDSVCPLCDVEWDSPELLRAHLQEKVSSSQEAARLEQRIKQATAELLDLLRAGRGVVRAASKLATTWAEVATQEAIQSWEDRLLALDSQLATVPGALAIYEQLEADPFAVPAGLTTALSSFAADLAAKPDTSAQAKARSSLIIAAERWSQLRLARTGYDAAAKAHELADNVYRAYCRVADEALTSLYDQVETRFSQFYQRINADDESGFKAELEPSAGKLDLLVDFYGLGMFPPGAYHSEGHQDGMGVCLYLALVEKLLGPAFRFAVLDDVVMSVDSNHRRQFCELLRAEFPNVQFVITTHDEIWAKQMQSSQLISKKSQLRFHGWSVDTGPASEQGSDFWARIDQDLAKDDVPAAAHKLRRGLEAELPELAEELRARVTYRGDAKYELGELLSAVKGRHNDWLKKAANSAASWNLPDAKQRVADLKDARSKALLAQDGENWAINALVHYNGWATMTKHDFAPVVQACREFLQLFRCDNDDCECWITVTGIPGKEDALRCQCGEYNVNLVSKSK